MKSSSPSPSALSRVPTVVVKEATPHPDDQVPINSKRKPSMVRQISLQGKEKIQEFLTPKEHVSSRYPEQQNTSNSLMDMEVLHHYYFLILS